MIVLLVPVVAIVAITVHDLVRRPTLRRLALRNVLRRKSEAALVLIGSLLGTAIITASFIVGDTLGASIRDSARTQLGPVDEVVDTTDFGRVDGLAAAIAQPPIPGTDGTLSLVASPAAAASVGAQRAAEPKASVLEVDFDQARRFGGDAGATGFADAGATPGPGEAVVGRDLSDKLELAAGDEVEVFAFGSSRRLRVRGVVPRLGVAGFGLGDNVESQNVFVAPGTIWALAAGGGGAEAQPPTGYVLVSNDGGVFDGAARSAAVADAVAARVNSPGAPLVEVEEVKQSLLDDADEQAKSFSELFGGIGAFSVIAGILLLVNVFVMLADERKSELGMLRALGLKRNQLVRAFGIEGALYSIAASVIGALLGVLVGRVIVMAAQGVFNQTDEFDLALRFSVEPGSLVTGFVVGAVISLVTVWAASIRMGRLNVIRAIRNLPEPVAGQRRLRTLVLATLGVVLGGLLFASGASSGRDGWFGAMAGPPIAFFCAIPLLVRVLSRRLVVTVACAAALVWGVVCFSLLPDVFENVDIPAFVVQGVILVGAAVGMGAVNSTIAVRAVSRLSVSNRTLAARLGLAYPLARMFRTSMLLGMYAIVVFTITFLAVFAKLFADQAPKFTAETRSGYDIVLDSNPGNPVTTEMLESQPEVARAAPLLRVLPDFTTPDHVDRERWPLSAFDARLLEDDVPTLSARRSDFADDRTAWEAVLRDPGLVVISDFFLQGGGPPESSIDPGTVIQMYDPTSGKQESLTVAGVAGNDWLLNGALIGAPHARDFFGDQATASRHYVKVRDGVEPDRAANLLTGRLLENGADAEPIATVIENGLRQQEGFLTLMEGYLALGLLIGVVGLGVVMVRAVRERRRQIGVLRALGFPNRVVRAAFLFEATFIAVQGLVFGMVLALVVSWELLANSKTFGEQQLDFTVPWLSLAVLLGVTLVASVIAALAPATQASRIKPAVALRIAD